MQPGVVHRSRWRQYTDPHAFAAWRQKMLDNFAALAAQVEAPATMRLEFSPQAGDEEILRLLALLPPVLLP